MRFLYAFLLCLLCGSLMSISQPAEAQSAAGISEQLSMRANDVLRLLQGEEIEAEVFDENFRNAVPPAQFRAISRQVTAQQGEPRSIVSISPRNANSAAIDALPGRQGVLVQQLQAGDLPPAAALDPDGRYAIASAFKLYILAELDRSVQAGERQWSDVVTLGPKSHPSGISQNWPDEAPVTLHTLATLMISISDNSATDTFIRIIGQDGLAQMVRATGHHQPDDLLPFLMTRQASALKMPVHAERRRRFLSASRTEREKLLADFDKDLTLDSLDSRLLTSKPAFIDQLEWFATPQDMIKLLAYLDRHASPEALAILAINPGIGQDAAGKWGYFGYKGGSGPGVLSFNFLLRSKAGKHHAVSVNWNNEQQSLQENELLALTTRLINLLAEQ